MRGKLALQAALMKKTAAGGYTAMSTEANKGLFVARTWVLRAFRFTCDPITSSLFEPVLAQASLAQFP